MPEQDPNQPVRVKDKDTGHVYTIRRVSLPHGNYQELKQDAVDVAGNFLPPEYAGDDQSQSATTKKEA